MGDSASTDAHQPSSPDIVSLLFTWGDNFTTQTSQAFSQLRLQDYIRLVIIIGGYCLLRPYLMKLGAHLQMKQHQADEKAAQEQAQEGGATLTANDLRGAKKAKIEIPGVDSDSDEDEEAQPGDWGRAARVRQRKFIRDLLQKHEDKLREEAEADSDKDIEEFLIKE